MDFAAVVFVVVVLVTTSFLVGSQYIAQTVSHSRSFLPLPQTLH